MEGCRYGGRRTAVDFPLRGFLGTLTSITKPRQDSQQVAPSLSLDAAARGCPSRIWRPTVKSTHRQWQALRCWRNECRIHARPSIGFLISRTGSLRLLLSGEMIPTAHSVRNRGRRAAWAAGEDGHRTPPVSSRKSWPLIQEAPHAETDSPIPKAWLGSIHAGEPASVSTGHPEVSWSRALFCIRRTFRSSRYARRRSQPLEAQTVVSAVPLSTTVSMFRRRLRVASVRLRAASRHSVLAR